MIYSKKKVFTVRKYPHIVSIFLSKRVYNVNPHLMQEKIIINNLNKI